MAFIQLKKNPIGAIRSGRSVQFRLTDISVEDVALMYKKDGETSVGYLPMNCVGNSFFAELFFDAPGLYFYAFFSPRRGYLQFFDNAVIGFADAECWLQQTVYDKDYAEAEPFEGGIAYQIFPDRFAISGKVKHLTDRVYHENLSEMPIWWPDKNGEVRNNDFYGGNLQGIIEKLPYLSDLNVDLIYLNPIFLSASNHRYDTSDYMRIDPQLGTEEDFVRLCDEAASFGMRIILDGVFSHTGSDSVYFNRYGHFDSVGAYQSKDSPYYSWYRFSEWPNRYGSWWGFHTLPEVEEMDPSYVEFITGKNGVIDYWMSLGASGFRLDVADELPDEFIEKIRIAIRRRNPKGLLIGEVWEDASNKVSYGVRRKYFLGKELDGTMNYPFRTAVLSYISQGDAGAFARSVESIVRNYPEEMLATCLNLLTSHDTPRAITVLADSFASSRSKEEAARRVLSREDYLRGVEMLKLAFAVDFFLPGIPMIYYGDEIGMQGYGDPFCRYFFSWDRIDTNLLECVKKLSDLRRKGRDILKKGRTEFFHAADSVIGFWRKGENGKIAFLLNRSEKDFTYIFDNGKVVRLKPWSYEVVFM